MGNMKYIYIKIWKEWGEEFCQRDKYSLDKSEVALFVYQ